jgi:hypothetical protein
MPLVIESGLTITPGITATPYITSDPTLDLGTQVSWSSGAMFDTWSSSSSATTDGTNNVDQVWQMFYAHKPLRITNGKAGARIGTSTSGSNSWSWWYAVSNNINSQTNFTAPTSFSNGSASYVSGGTYTSNFTTTINIPQFRYFIIGRVFGPFYYSSRNLAANRTAVISGVPYFTVINRLWKGGGASTPMTIPTQLGGASGTWTAVTGISQVAGLLLDVV